MAILIPEVVFNCLLGPAGGLGMPVPMGYHNLTSLE